MASAAPVEKLEVEMVVENVERGYRGEELLCL